MHQKTWNLINLISKNQFVYTESGWDILKISDELGRKLKGEFPKRETKRQRESIRKKVTN